MLSQDAKVFQLCWISTGQNGKCKITSPSYKDSTKFLCVNRTSPLGNSTLEGCLLDLKMILLYTFQRRWIVSLMEWQYRVTTYIDDIAVYSQTWEQHLQNLKEVFSLLQSAGLTLRTDKCTLGTDSCEFLGHIAGCGTRKRQD